jgi:hypothetical protein
MQVKINISNFKGSLRLHKKPASMIIVTPQEISVYSMSQYINYNDCISTILTQLSCKNAPWQQSFMRLKQNTLNILTQYTCVLIIS